VSIGVLLALGLGCCAHAETQQGRDSDRPAGRTGAPTKKRPPRLQPKWTVRVGTGFDYSSGLYGDVAPTRVTSLPLSVSASRGSWRLRASVPYVRLSGPSSLVVLEGGSLAGSPQSGLTGINTEQTFGSRRVRGLGDLSLSATYEKKLTDSGWWFETSARVKLPTGSRRKGLSSGKADLTLSADISRDIEYGNIYVSGRKRLIGKSGDFPLRSTWGMTVGGSYDLTDKLSAGLDYDWEQSPYSDEPDTREVTAWGSYQLQPNLRVQVYGTRGENDSSADTAFGAGLSWRLN
jgi:hypothetical protein